MPPARRLIAPIAVLVVGAAGVALALMLSTALRIPVLASFDEAVYKLSAAQYADGGLGAVLRDDVARGVARLYSLLIAPLFAVLPADSAIRAGRALNTVLWALTAAPVFLLARRVTSSWLAAVAALLAIAVPWATVSTVLFSESLAYLLLACAILAMVAALERPGPGREALVLVLLAALVLTRMQFIGLPVVWVLLVAGFELVPVRRKAGPRAALVTTARRFPLTAAVVVLALLAVVVVALAGRLSAVTDRIGGPYVADRDALPTDVGQAALFEATMLAFGTGVLPTVLAVHWGARALGGGLGGGPRRLVVVGLAALAAVFGVALAGQSGWQGPDISEERYYIYAAPLIFVGAAAALGASAVRMRTLVVGGVAVAALLALVPTTAGLSGERAFLVPVAATSSDVAGRLNGALAEALNLSAATGQRDLMVLVALLVVALAVVAGRRWRPLVLLPAVVLQLAFGGYALATMHGKVPGVGGLTGPTPETSQAWIDRATAGDPDVTLLDDGLEPERRGAVALAFFNDELRRTLRLPEQERPALPYPVSALPFADAAVGADLRLQPEPGARLLVVTKDSPVLQLAAEMRYEDGGAAVVVPARPVRATWTVAGLAADGAVPGPVAVRAAPARLTLTFDALAEAPGGAVRVRLGNGTEEVDVAPGGRAQVHVDLCGERVPAAGAIELAGAPPAAVRLRAVAAEAC